MDILPKAGTGCVRGVKLKGSLKRVRPRQQTKFTNTLEQWLVKPSEDSSTTEHCQNKEDVEMTEDDDFQCTSAQSLDCRKAEKHSVSDTDEETQPLTPQDFDQEDNDVGLEKQERETCLTSSVGSVKNGPKITDFFSGISSPGLPVRWERSDKSSDEDTDVETTSAHVKWLGTPISELKRMPGCSGPLPPLKDVPGQHTVMIRV